MIRGNLPKGDDRNAAENKFVYKGINVHQIPSNPYSYGLQLLDALLIKMN